MTVSNLNLPLLEALSNDDEPLLADLESNDTIPEATSTGLASSGSVQISAEIGNNPNLSFSANDVDIYAVQLNAGDRLIADVDTGIFGSGLDSVLSIFDSTGTLVAQNDDFLNIDSFINFTATFADTYYVGVSSFENFDYDPFAEGSGIGDSSGSYDLTISVNLPVFNGRLDEFLSFNPIQYLASNEDLITSGIDPTLAREDYEQLGLAEGRSADSFDEVRYLASHGDLIAAFGLDFTAASEHYVNFGVAEGRSTNSFDPVAYLDIHPDLQTAFGNNLFAATAHYIQFGFFEGRDSGSSEGLGPSIVIPGSEGDLESNDTISEATSTGLIGPGTVQISAEIGNNPSLSFLENDIDLYAVQLNAGERLSADIDAENLGSGLDSVLTVFDSAGTVVAQNDDFASIDSFVEFTADFDDTYYIGVSSFENFDYDPFVEGSGIGNSLGFYDLTIDVDTSVSGGRLDELLNFDPIQYLASHQDLITAFGLNPALARQHYEQFGLVEERSADSFDEVRYLASHEDLIAAFGLNFAAASEHYVSFGAAEGRQTNSFDPLAYLSSNSDLQAAFGSNLFAAAEHYIQFGVFEGRNF